MRTVCRLLRTKLAFGSLHQEPGGVPDWREGEDPAAVYWCLGTMETGGPDGGLAHPQGCGPGRACFERDADHDEDADENLA